jgi:RNA polymerase sigma-70 factor, ECF subfamily
VAKAILQQIAAGDKTSVQECLRTYGGLVWSLARRMSPNLDDAEDAVQEIFVDVWKNADKFDETKSSETTFIAMIARRRLIDRIRKVNRSPKSDSIEDMPVEPQNRFDESMQVSIEAKQAAKALETLRPEQRQVLQLSIYHGYSHQEIADVLQMPIGTVKTHARRGIIQVREVLGVNKKEANV